MAGGVGFNRPTAELFDGTSTFSATGNMIAPRIAHSATLLPSGRVLIAGGAGGGTGAELFDGSSTFTATGSMTNARTNHTATLLNSGKVLVAGGQVSNVAMATAELFDGISTFTATSTMLNAHSFHAATLLPSGKVLVAGGSAELFNLAPLGAVCAVGDDCGSAICKGLCCSAPCNGAANSCDATGACKLTTGQPSSDPTQCASGFAADGYCCNTACTNSCDVCAQSLGAATNGACSPASVGYLGAPACSNGYACDGTNVTCATSCTSDADCQPTDYCTGAGACQPRKAQSSACNPAMDCKTAGTCRECLSGNCADGFCCDMACKGLCQACSAVLKQSSSGDGTCGPAKVATNPHNDACPTSLPATCGPDGVCDGTGNCRQFYPSGTSCGTSICSAVGNMAQGQLCTGAGVCGANSGVACDPYICASGSCPTTCTVDAQCIAAYFCTTAHVCAPKEVKGTPCASPMQCASGICVDGVCCDQACGGECQACDVAGAPGTCSNVTGAPHGARTACKAGGTTCGGTCDGTNAASCTYPSGKSCATSCTNGQETDSTCNSNGDCVAAAAHACGGSIVTCNGTTCKTTCANDADCAPGFGCTGGACKPRAAASCDTADNHHVIDPMGGRSACDPYTCSGGVCQKTCSSINDCVAPSACDPTGQCVAPSGGTSSGCAVAHVTGDAHDAPLSLLIGSAVVALLASRRRRGAVRPRGVGTAGMS